MRLLILLPIILINFNSYAQSLAKTFPTIGDKPVVCITPVNDGGFILLLKHDNTIGTGATPVLIKTDANFNTIWSKRIYITGVDHDNTKIQQLSDGGYLLFYSFDNIAKFNSVGDLIWNTSLVSGSMISAYSHNRTCIEKPDGKLVFMSTDYADFKIFQFSSDGTFEWGQKLYSTDPEGYGKCPGFDLLPFSDGSIFVTGKRGNDNCFARIDALGNVLWSSVIDFDDTYSRPWGMELMEDGNVMVVGVRTDKGFIMKMSAVDGSVIWQKEVNNMYFEDVMYIGNNQYSILGKDNWDMDDLGVLVIDGECELVSSMKFMNHTNWATYPKLSTANGKNYFSTQGDPYSSGGLNFLQFDSSLVFSCTALPLTITKIAFTLPVISLSPLEVATEVPGYSYSTFTVTDVVSTVDFSDFCAESNETPTTMNEDIPDPIIGENMSSTSLNENSLTEKITVYPNPANQNSPISITVPTGGDYSVQLMDVYGKIIFKNDFSGFSTAIPSSNLAKGIYLVKVSSINTQRTSSQKLIVN